jgi:hypothetical protein
MGAALLIGQFFALTEPWPAAQANLKLLVGVFLEAGLVLWLLTIGFQISEQLSRFEDFSPTRRLRWVAYYLAHDCLAVIVTVLVALTLWNLPAWLKNSGVSSFLATVNVKDVSTLLLLAGMAVFLIVFLRSTRDGEAIEFQTQWGGLGGGGGGWRISTPAVCIVVFLMLALTLGITQLQVKYTPPADSTTDTTKKPDAAPADDAAKKPAEETPAKSTKSEPASPPAQKGTKG